MPGGSPRPPPPPPLPTPTLETKMLVGSFPSATPSLFPSAQTEKALAAPQRDTKPFFLLRRLVLSTPGLKGGDKRFFPPGKTEDIPARLPMMMVLCRLPAASMPLERPPPTHIQSRRIQFFAPAEPLAPSAISKGIICDASELPARRLPMPFGLRGKAPWCGCARILDMLLGPRPGRPRCLKNSVGVFKAPLDVPLPPFVPYRASH